MKKHIIKRRSLEVNVNKKLINSIAAGITIAIVIMVVQYLNFEGIYGQGSSAIIYASVGSTAFILFIMPKSRAADKPSVLASYAFSGVVGYLSYILSIYTGLVIAAGVAVAGMAAVMVILKHEHPPATGLALAFVLYKIGSYGILLVITIGVLIVIIAYLLEKVITDVEREV